MWICRRSCSRAQDVTRQNRRKRDVHRRPKHRIESYRLSRTKQSTGKTGTVHSSVVFPAYRQQPEGRTRDDDKTKDRIRFPKQSTMLSDRLDWHSRSARYGGAKTGTWFLTLTDHHTRIPCFASGLARLVGVCAPRFFCHSCHFAHVRVW